jgi:hypothetical protein
MPQTCLRIRDKNIVFITQQQEKALYIALYSADEEFKPMGPPQESIHEDPEETWHKNLRRDASEKGHYVPQFSTNPEWNPVKTDNV